MKGSDIKTARTGLGWTRNQLAAACGDNITAQRICSIEGGGKFRDGEEAVLREGLKAALGQAVMSPLTDGEVKPPPIDPSVVARLGAADPDDPDAEVILEEWCGLTKGATVKLAEDVEAGKHTTYTFIRYRRTPGQEYVELRAKNGATRNIVPSRLRTKQGRVWMSVLPGGQEAAS